MRSDIPEIDRAKLAEMARTCACFNFRKASRSVTQLFDQILAPTGLRSTQLVILMTGQLLGPSSIARLARELVMDRSTLTRNLKPLLNLGMLQLSKSETGECRDFTQSKKLRACCRNCACGSPVSSVIGCVRSCAGAVVLGAVSPPTG